jgi:cell division septation protein DedD
MENRMRDLEQIQERDPSDSGHRLGGILMATAAMVGLTFAIGVLVGQAAEPEPEAPDPLALLEKAGAVPPARDAKPEEAVVERSELSFARTLSDEEERPEVLAALQAAAVEVQDLQDPARPAAEIGSPDEVGDSAAAEAALAAPAPAAQPPSQEEIAAVMPAAVAAGSVGQKLPNAARRDPMVAAAIPDERPGEAAPVGTEGEFCLQVISYETAEPARSFAEGLRARGHRAFVTSADLPDRGRYYRVRIGPFDTRPEAEAYRRKFETDEGMNTFVVKRPKDGEAG